MPELVRERPAAAPVGGEAEGAGAQGHPADVGGFGDDQMHEVRPDPVAQVVHLVEVIVGRIGETENVDAAVARPGVRSST